MKALVILILLLNWGFSQNAASTIALWCFDEQTGIYPSCVLSDHSENDYPLVLGPGGQIVPGKFGNALEPSNQPAITLPESKSVLFGMKKQPITPGKKMEPLTWHNARFCALMTSTENHLRKQVGFAKPTTTDLNLGDFDWTVEFWYLGREISPAQSPAKMYDKSPAQGVIFEIGEGPRGENNNTTSLILNRNLKNFEFYNQPSNTTLLIPSNADYLDDKHAQWHHYAFVYNSDARELSHYVDGQLQALPEKAAFSRLNMSAEDYMSIGRDGKWGRPLQGKIDELRFSKGMVYINSFNSPGSFSELTYIENNKLNKGLPLLFAGKQQWPIDFGSRKHLFIDDVLFENTSGLEFKVNPPKFAERVIDNIQGSYRKHLNIVEDEDGLLRMYSGVSDDYLAVMISGDGINWEIPKLPNGKYKNHTNVVIHEPTGMGVVFIDPNAPAQERWKYVSGFHDRGVFIYTSPDGYNFKRMKTAVLAQWAGSQTNTFYDEQQQQYIAYHRADFARGAGGSTQREFVMTRTKNLLSPWPFKPSTQQEGLDLAKRKSIKDLLPFYLDNGPLTPGGFAHEYPVVFEPTKNYDPDDTDIYVPKALKYPWAEDVYLAFPTIYFHYKKSSPITRMALNAEQYQRGSGPLETQLSVSRDAVNWNRFPRPAYVGIGRHENRNVVTTYMAHGMIRRSDEIWQYYFGETQYHSAIKQDPDGRGVYRLVQRLDGFVSLNSPYDREIEVITKPFTFNGNCLTLNIDTEAAGYAQVGFLDAQDNPIEGFSVDDCIYINGDFIACEVEWMQNRAKMNKLVKPGVDKSEDIFKQVKISKDLSALKGKIVKLIFRMRASKLYAMQFYKK